MADNVELWIIFKSGFDIVSTVERSVAEILVRRDWNKYIDYRDIEGENRIVVEEVACIAYRELKPIPVVVPSPEPVKKKSIWDRILK